MKVSMSDIEGLERGIPIRRTMRVRIRRDLAFGEVKAGADSLDGEVYRFRLGWKIEDDDSRYPGEWAWLPTYADGYPLEGPAWIASGDLEEVEGETACK